MKKRLLSIVFALLMLCQLLSFSILAEPTYGDNNELPGQNWETPVYYKVTLPTGDGYTIVYDSGVEVVDGGVKIVQNDSFSFTITITTGYNGENMVVKANGETLTATDDVYTITVTEAVEITVEGVEEESETLKGDINLDGEVNAKDVSRLRLYVAELVTSIDGDGDVNGDGEVNAKDVSRLRLYVAELISAL